MEIVGEILFWSIFSTSAILVVFPSFCSSLFFKWLDRVIEKSEGDATSDW
jgi:hypothetical protein